MCPFFPSNCYYGGTGAAMNALPQPPQDIALDRCIQKLTSKSDITVELFKSNLSVLFSNLRHLNLSSYEDTDTWTEELIVLQTAVFVTCVVNYGLILHTQSVLIFPMN